MTLLYFIIINPQQDYWWQASAINFRKIVHVYRSWKQIGDKRRNSPVHGDERVAVSRYNDGTVIREGSRLDLRRLKNQEILPHGKLWQADLKSGGMAWQHLNLGHPQDRTKCPRDQY